MRVFPVEYCGENGGESQAGSSGLVELLKRTLKQEAETLHNLGHGTMGRRTRLSVSQRPFYAIPA
ncbi:MAG TPA: hypothetical protein VJK27_09845 [Terriglobales bacterium]|nr:hypothetical protein [Terriglobales bacterium]